jgi:hypothetical protein
MADLITEMTRCAMCGTHIPKGDECWYCEAEREGLL